MLQENFLLLLAVHSKLRVCSQMRQQVISSQMFLYIFSQVLGLWEEKWDVEKVVYYWWIEFVSKFMGLFLQMYCQLLNNCEILHYHSWWSQLVCISKYWNMKVVISKSGLAVSVPKNANISRTILAMKILKLGLCRGRLALSCHIKI